MNDPALTERMLPALLRVGEGAGGVRPMPRSMPAEDFSYFAQAVPALCFNVGVTAPGVDPLTVPTNRSPRFRVEAAGLIQGLRAMLHLVADYTGSGAAG